MRGAFPVPVSAPIVPRMSSPAWARGYGLAELKGITAMIGRHEAGLIHGAFGRYSERDAAADLEAGRLRLGPFDARGEPAWAISTRQQKRQQGVRDFTGAQRLVLPPLALSVARIAWQEGRLEGAVQELRGLWPAALNIWQEHPEQRQLPELLGLQLGAVKIAASSELRGIYVRPALAPEPYPRHQAIGLARLPIPIPLGDLAALIEQIRRLGDYAQHYSSYNARGSWTALSLRGFYDEPERIEKPSEMSKRWKADRPGHLEREIRDTPLRARLGAVEPILGCLPGRALERVRLMALAPGGGELTRHADITDPDAGAEIGKVLRLHIPLITNPRVRFTSWDLEGRRHAGSMRRGGVYYLDTRKPHTAHNDGESPRIHLVADVVADAELIAALAGAEEFPPA